MLIVYYSIHLFSLCVMSLSMGILAGISLPVGAAVGMLIGTVSEEWCGGILALGAGASLFAVTIAIYGKMLRDRSHDHHNIATLACIIGGLLGSVFFSFVIDLTRREPVELDSEEESLQSYGIMNR